MTDAIDFYEREFYPLSNFSAFTLQWDGRRFDTSEAAYHWEKFPPDRNPDASKEDNTRRHHLCWAIRTASSAHDAFKLAEKTSIFAAPTGTM